VLVADAQRLFAESLGAIISSHPGMTVEAEYPSTGTETVKAALLLTPDVLLADYWMPEIGGPAIAAHLQREAPKIKVILLSWSHGPAQIQTALGAGVAGFLPKTVSADQVVEAIRRSQAGESLVYAEELARLLETMQSRMLKSDEVWARMLTLTAREREILTILSTGSPIEEIAGRLSIAKGTINAHIHNILAKTGARSHGEALAMARFCGLLGPSASENLHE